MLEIGNLISSPWKAGETLGIYASCHILTLCLQKDILSTVIEWQIHKTYTCSPSHIFQAHRVHMKSHWSHCYKYIVPCQHILHHKSHGYYMELLVLLGKLESSKRQRIKSIHRMNSFQVGYFITFIGQGTQGPQKDKFTHSNYGKKNSRQKISRSIKHYCA